MKVRTLTEADRPLLESWIAKDEYHRDTTTADFFYEEGTETMVFEDDHGPVFFLRGSRALRLDVQFDNEQGLRNAHMLVDTKTIIPEWAKTSGFKEILFNSTSKSLIGFCKRVLGYSPSPDEFRKVL